METYNPYDDDLVVVSEFIYCKMLEIYIKEEELGNYEAPEPDLPYLSDISNFVIHLSRNLRPYFQEVFEASFPEKCTSNEEFAAYTLSIMELFLRPEFECLTLKVGHRDVDFTLFGIVAAFISELLFVFMKKKCYKYIKTASKCLMMVYHRWFATRIESNGGWIGFRNYCNHYYPIYDSLPYSMTDKIMGFHKLSREMTEIFENIEECQKEYNRIRIVLSDSEKSLLYVEKKKANTDMYKCNICEHRCKFDLLFFLRELDENSYHSCCSSSDDL